MAVPSQYLSEAGELEAARLYTAALEALPFAVQERSVPTQFGAAHVLVAGPLGAPPLMLWQGTGMSAPCMLLICEELAKHYRVYAPDNPSQFGSRSAPANLDAGTHDNGRWCADVVRGLGLDPTSSKPGPHPEGPSSSSAAATAAAAAQRALLHVGISFGGALILDLAVVAPELISAAALIVPGSLHPGYGGFLHQLWLTLRFLLPMTLYRYVPGRWTRWLVMSAICDDPFDESLPAQQMTASFMHAAWFPPAPRRLEDEELARLTAPVLVFAAKRDVFGGGEATAERARRVLPRCEVELENCKHVPDGEVWWRLDRRILRFFAESGFPGTDVQNLS